ncbi:U3 small nucleolar RNA-associated protein 6-like [Holothuria leucospilota]|uniref:U3 small nucleolar RNA-associated protein 6-like n=1 Tax=Holothuria leucospilota TaxID=206669 RepID=A0A9Q1C6H3_HOLLE|nr:U3 small nucleolar RNA-associated protein 6-like [Holothuria leucospilota]
MAEYVHRNLEETLPELEQLERVGLFSRDEIKSIIKRRTAHEYRMNRLKNDKEDFLKYIEYEKDLLNLIKKRRKKIKYYFKETDIEHAIVVRIQRLYRRLCTLFPHDLTIWLSHIRFLHEWNRMSRLSQLFTKLLKVNSRIPGLWILAAKTQLEYNNNPDDARRLLLRALRHHPNSQKLWTEYFRMELLHAYKLNKRMAILQQSQMSLEEDEASLLKGKLAKLVYKSALKAIPDNIQFRLQFAKISEEFDFTRDITDEIYDDLLADHPDKELTWNVLARRPLTFLDKKANGELSLHKIWNHPPW